VCLGSTRVDGDDFCVRERAAQERAVEHAGQLHVIDIVAMATHEASIFLAEHTTEPNRVTGFTHGYCWWFFDDGHAVAPSVAGWAAAH
jgi:uncharacterized protein YjaZ